MQRADEVAAVHRTTIELRTAITSEIEAGAAVAVTVWVYCPEGCDLRDAPVALRAGDRAVATSERVSQDGESPDTRDIAFNAPDTVGEHAWAIIFPRHETGSCIHEESSVPVCFRTIPHGTSLAVWAVPSPVVTKSSFSIKIGVKCSVQCRLTGHDVEVLNELGAKVGHSRLMETPWPGTDSLYWATVQLTAPTEECVKEWTVKFPDGGAGLPHDEASVTFSFRTARPPEHRVTIQVVARETGLPVPDVEVRVGIYEVFTDELGTAAVEVPQGGYDLGIRKDGYQAPPLRVEVHEDVTLRVEAMPAPTKAEIEDMMKRFEGETWR